MIKNNNKSQKELPQIPDEAKHKKKKVKKDSTPWEKHKHKYETVLLEYPYVLYNNSVRLCKHPAKVCMICGRYDSMVKDSKYYIEKRVIGLPFLCMEKELSEEAYKLPVWHMSDWLDKVAIKGELKNQEEK